MTAHAGKERGDRPWVAFTARLPTRAAFAALAAMLCALAIAAFVFAPPARSQGESGARYTGVASCAGSTCHGRLEGDGTGGRQDGLGRKSLGWGKKLYVTVERGGTDLVKKKKEP